MYNRAAAAPTAAAAAALPFTGANIVLMLVAILALVGLGTAILALVPRRNND